MKNVPITAEFPRTSKRRKSLIWWIVATATTITVAFLVFRAFSGTKAAEQPYQVISAVRTTVESTVVASGSLQPWTVVDIKSKAGGKVEEMRVEIGDPVVANQVLARIDPSDSQLAVDQANADLASALSKRQQSRESLSLSQSETQAAINDATARLNVAYANLSAAQARLKTARDAVQAQKVETEAAIRQARESYLAAVADRSQLDADQRTRASSISASLREAEESQRYARTDYERKLRLAEQGYVSDQVVQQAKYALEAADAKLTVAQSDAENLKSIQAAQRASSDANVARAKAQVDDAVGKSVSIRNRANELKVAEADLRSSEQQVRQAKVARDNAVAGKRNTEIRRLEVASSNSSVMRAQAAVDNAKKTLNSTVLRAPSPGIVLKKYVEQGTIITSGQSLASTGTSILQLGDVTRMYVSVQVDETDIAKIKVGQRVKVEVDAFEDEVFRGQVIRIEPTATVEQNVTTVAVRVEVDNRSAMFRELKPNMNATCTFSVNRTPDVVAVPNEAVQSDQGGHYVNVVLQGDAAEGTQMMYVIRSEKRRVELGMVGDSVTEVKSGLSVGERIALPRAQASESARSREQQRNPFGGFGPGGPGRPGGGGPPPGP